MKQVNAFSKITLWLIDCWRGHGKISQRISLILAQLLFISLAISAQSVSWEVQSDYFGERNAVAQTRTIRSMALSKDGSAVYTGNIQSPNVGSNAIRKVSTGILATPGTDHVIFGNGMPGGTGAFGPVGGQPVYDGGATGTFLAWAQTGNSPRGLATDDRGYVYVALSSGISPANQVLILSSDLSTTIGMVSITGPTGVSVLKSGSTYYLYIAADTQLKRYDVTNAASPVLDAGWTNAITSGAFGLTVDSDGTVFLVGNDLVRRISAAGVVTHSTGLTAGGDVAVLYDKIYVVRRGSPTLPISVFNKADLTSGGADLVVPELGDFTRGSLSQFTAIDVSADGRIWVSEENYTGGGNGIPSYTPPATSFNPTPGAITGRIYFDRVLVSSPFEAPCDVAITNITPSAETCPGANDGSITVTATTSFGPLTYSISGPVSQSNNTGIFSDLPDGSYTITVSDDGLEGCTATAMITVDAGVDSTPPMISCSNQTITFGGEFSILLDAAALASATDECGTPSLSLSTDYLYCSDAGTTVPVVVTATDASNNPATCTSYITVEGLPCGFSSDPDGINCSGGSDASYDAETETFTLESDGCYSGNFAADNAAYVSYDLCGDAEIIAHVSSISPLGQGWAGISMRESNAPGSKKVAIATNLGNLGRREVRTTTNGYSVPQQFFRPGATWLRLVRTGNQFLGYMSSDGINWQLVVGTNVSMNSCIEVGLYVTNYNSGLVTATFDNVDIDESDVPSLVTPEVDQNQPAGLHTDDFTLFPNPAKEKFYLNLENYYDQEAQIVIVNALGQPVLSRQVDQVGSSPMEFDLKGLSNGAYFVNIITANGTKVKQFVIAK